MSIRRAVIYASIERYYGFALAFISTIVISRLLTPAEVGAFSVAMSLAGVASGLREFGASAFLIRTPQLEKHHESCAFGMTLLLGISLGLLMLAIAEPVATFFGQSSVTPLLQVLSLNFFLLPFGTINNALLQRAMRYDVLARINIIAGTLSFICTVGLAWLGYGALSLAWGSVFLSVCAAGLCILWGPGTAVVKPRLRGASELMRFGSQTTGLNLLWDISARYPEFILGKMQSFATAGLMARATGLAHNVNDLLLKGLNSVALSYFSKIQRENNDPVQAHLRIATLITGLGWPALIGLAFFAEPITLALYGEQWLGIVWPLRIICLQLCLSLPFCFQMQLIIAKGEMKQQIKASVVAAVFRFPIITIGAMCGIIETAISLVVAQLIGIFIGMHMVWPLIDISWSNYTQVIIKNLSALFITITSYSTAVYTAVYFKIPYQVTLLGLGPITLIIILIGYYTINHPLISEAKALFKPTNKHPFE